MARNFRCSICDERKAVAPRPLAHLEAIPKKWKNVQADVGKWTNQKTGKGFQFLLFFDEGCRLKVGKVIIDNCRNNATPEMLIDCYQELWKPYFGSPDHLRLDSAGEFLAERLHTYFDKEGTFVDNIPGDAHWHISIVESAVKGVESLLEALFLEDPSITPKQALAEALWILNSKETVRGFTCIQHALGRSPDEEG